MAVILILLSLIFVAGRAVDGVARDPARAALRRRGGGLALVVACLNVVFRDVEHVLAAALLPWFFVTPILWSAQTLGDRAVRHHTLLERLALGESGCAADLRDP